MAILTTKAAGTARYYIVGSKTIAMFGYFALHVMWCLIAWKSRLELAG